ncbi:hypothetical protein BUALT_Bualt01G0236300 [Buddleja alternifolia]|uniref:Uncharacterized protein n=1 Tax=Buddleja alternifolia TaxID=168488 RepID=A0AAV6YH98_9LAMI|nr:hypothetical protein BUALT_Bualt01G0236300 [Buddleja alternifolia]
MELMKKDNLKIQAWKTWDLHGRINEKINENGFNFCRHCSNHGRYCVISESSMEEKEKMVAIRDSLKDVHNILIYLQSVKSSHKRETDEALSRLEKSRNLLIEMINKCSEKERKIDVIEELMKFLGDGKNEFPWNLKVKFCKSRQQREDVASDDSRMAGKFEFLLNDSNNIHLDVLCGRG